MKKSNRKSVSGMLMILSLPFSLSGLSFVQPASAAPPEKPISTPNSPIANDASVTQAEEHLRLVTVGFQIGANSNEDVSDAKIALADTRIHAACVRNQFTSLQQDLETISTERQKRLDWVNMKWKSGEATPSDTNTAEEALAEARVRLDLYSVLIACQKRLTVTSVRQSAGLSSAEEMGKATASLQRAELQFVESGTDR